MDQPSEAPTPPPIISTAYSAEIANVIEGSAQVGDVIEIKELGGVHRGASYVPEGDTSIAAADVYLMFLAVTAPSPTAS